MRKLSLLLPLVPAAFAVASLLGSTSVFATDGNSGQPTMPTLPPATTAPATTVPAPTTVTPTATTTPAPVTTVPATVPASVVPTGTTPASVPPGGPQKDPGNGGGGSEQTKPTTGGAPEVSTVTVPVTTPASISVNANAGVENGTNGQSIAPVGGSVEHGVTTGGGIENPLGNIMPNPVIQPQYVPAAPRGVPVPVGFLKLMALTLALWIAVKLANYVRLAGTVSPSKQEPVQEPEIELLPATEVTYAPFESELSFTDEELETARLSWASMPGMLEVEDEPELVKVRHIARTKFHQ